MDSSSTFGSIITIFSSDGVALNKRLEIILFKATLLPDPVAPATSRCGIFVMSVTIGLPEISFPSANGSLDFNALNCSDAIISLRNTSSLNWFGTSIPSVDLPCSGATMRTLPDFNASARSSDRFTILDSFTPGAGSNSYIVITGPGCTSTTCPSIPKSSSFFSRTFEFIRSSSLFILLSDGGGSLNIDKGGSLYVPSETVSLNSKCSC